MDVSAVIAVIGGIALLVGIFGGGVEAEKIKIPTINSWVRVISVITGIALITTSAILANPELLISPVTAPTSSLSTIVPGEIQPTQNITSPRRNLTSSDYGKLLYEDTFDSDTGVWLLEKGSRIQDGLLALSPSEHTVPSWDTSYSDFIFETSFQFVNTVSTEYSGMSVYLRYVLCASSQCSDQVGVSTKGEVSAWSHDGAETKRVLAGTFAPDFNSTGTNKFTVIVNKSEYQIFLNDVYVRSFSNPENKSGIIVLDVDGTSIGFEYIRIYATP